MADSEIAAAQAARRAARSGAGDQEQSHELTSVRPPPSAAEERRLKRFENHDLSIDVSTSAAAGGIDDDEEMNEDDRPVRQLDSCVYPLSLSRVLRAGMTNVAALQTQRPSISCTNLSTRGTLRVRVDTLLQGLNKADRHRCRPVRGDGEVEADRGAPERLPPASL